MFNDLRRPKLVYPDYSLATFERRLRENPSQLTCEVQLTCDHIPLMSHESDLAISTEGSGFIWDLTFPEIRRFHLCNGEPIPTLFGLLEMIYPLPVQLNIVLGSPRHLDEHIIPIVLALVQDYPLAHPVHYAVFLPEMIRQAQHEDPAHQYLLLTSSMSLQDISLKIPIKKP